MTFIASVVAKKGVAVIADSLVTSSSPILHQRKFLDFIASCESEGKPINVTDLNSLFEWEPIYTKDFEEKIFKLNKYTAITTTGIAEINNKNIFTLVNDFLQTKGVLDFSENIALPLIDKVNAFTDYLTEQIKEHLTKFKEIGVCVFLFSFYDPRFATTTIHKVSTVEADDTSLQDPDFEYFSHYPQPDWATVVCDGQNKITDSILYGFGRALYLKFNVIVKNIIDKLNLPEGSVPDNIFDQLVETPFFKEMFYEDIEMLNLSSLSLQQAVDLASLLMRVVVDFQKYTRNIPTVGGLIKLAVIDDDGFRFILGHEIQPPKHIHL